MVLRYGSSHARKGVVRALLGWAGGDAILHADVSCAVCRDDLVWRFMKQSFAAACLRNS